MIIIMHLDAAKVMKLVTAAGESVVNYGSRFIFQSENCRDPGGFRKFQELPGGIVVVYLYVPNCESEFCFQNLNVPMYVCKALSTYIGIIRCSIVIIDRTILNNNLS